MKQKRASSRTVRDRSDAASAGPGARRITARDWLRTLYVYTTLSAALVFYLVAFGWFLLLAAITFDRRRRIARRLARAMFPRLIRHYGWLAGAPVKMILPDLPWRDLGPCIVVANHSSSMDVLLLMMLPLPVGVGRVWAKGWPFKKPLLGWLMRLSGHLLVEDFNLLPDAQGCLADGESLLVFPESSRSRSGQLARFRDGAFLLAARTGRPIIPVALHGSHASFPPGQGMIFRPVLTVEVLGILRPPAPGAHGAANADDRAHLQLKRQASEMIRTALAAKNSSPGRDVKEAVAA